MYFKNRFVEVKCKINYLFRFEMQRSLQGKDFRITEVRTSGVRLYYKTLYLCFNDQTVSQSP